MTFLKLASYPVFVSVERYGQYLVSYRLRVTENGEIVSKHDTGVVQINLSQDEVKVLTILCLTWFGSINPVDTGIIITSTWSECSISTLCQR